ncbi:hypothetical protein J0H58_24405 [bacterium]|nr:hypothetical protein [bacterium]
MTDDPLQPEAQVLLRVTTVTGGVVLSPPTVAFGSLDVGATGIATVTILDPSREGRQIERVESAAKGVTARFEPTAGATPPAHADAARELGRVILSVDTTEARDLSGEVRVVVLGRATPDVIPVVGRVVSPVTVAPRLVSIPLHTDNGLIYRASLVMRAGAGKRLNVRVDEASKRLAVRCRVSSSDPAVAEVEIECVERPDQREVSITRFTAIVDGAEFPIAVPVAVAPD